MNLVSNVIYFQIKCIWKYTWNTFLKTLKKRVEKYVYANAFRIHFTRHFETSIYLPKSLYFLKIYIWEKFPKNMYLEMYFELYKVKMKFKMNCCVMSCVTLFLCDVYDSESSMQTLISLMLSIIATCHIFNMSTHAYPKWCISEHICCLHEESQASESRGRHADLSKLLSCVLFPSPQHYNPSPSAFLKAFRFW